jgi:hypothetical protein
MNTATNFMDKIQTHIDLYIPGEWKRESEEYSGSIKLRLYLVDKIHIWVNKDTNKGGIQFDAPGKQGFKKGSKYLFKLDSDDNIVNSEELILDLLNKFF